MNMQNCSQNIIITKNTELLMNTLFHFRSDATRYCVDVSHVEQVTWLPSLSSSDGAPVWLTGLLNLQGRSVPVIDFSRFMGHAARPFSVDQKLLVLKQDDHRVAIIVDQVDGLEAGTGEVLPLSRIQIAHTQLDVELSSVLLGQVRHGDDMVMLVNAEKLLDVPQHWPVQGERAVSPGVSDDAQASQVFMARMHKLATTPVAEDAKNQIQFAIVSTGSRMYAIHLDQIVEFTRLRQYTLLPGSPASIVGCMNLRGELFSIVDIGTLAGSTPSPRNASVVVLKHQGHRFSCLIGSIDRLVSVDESHVVAMHDNEELHPLAKNLLRDGDDVTTILNLEAVVALCDAQQKVHVHI